MAVYYSAIAAQVLVVTGDRYVKGLDPLLAGVTYFGFFVGVAVFAFALGGAYSRRIWSLRSRRAELLELAGFRPSPLVPHVLGSVDSPSWLYVALVILLSIVGAILTIFGVPATP